MCIWLFPALFKVQQRHNMYCQENIFKLPTDVTHEQRTSWRSGKCLSLCVPFIITEFALCYKHQNDLKIKLA